MSQETPPPPDREPESTATPDADGTQPGERSGGASASASARAESRYRPIEANVKSKSTWLRLFFIVFFVIAYGVAEFLLTIVVVIQFLWVLVNGEPNERLRVLGQSLARYNYQIVRYFTFNSDQRPFPIDLDWPPGTPGGDVPYGTLGDDAPRVP